MLKKVRSSLKNQKGFTLIELLAVIVILGIIAAIAIPSVTNIIQKSKSDAVYAEAQQVLSAAKLYAANNDISTTAPVTITNNNGTKTGGLDQYLDHPGTYSVTITNTNGTITYSAISVTKNGITKTYATEADVNNNNPS